MTTPHAPSRTEVIQILRGCPLFRFYLPSDIEQFAARTTCKNFTPGQLICARGAVGDEFYLVLHGAVQITVPTLAAPASTAASAASSDAAEAIVRVVTRGDYFGEIACLEENGRRTASARAQGHCTLLVVSREEFLLLVQSHPPAAMGLVRHLAARVRHHTDTLAGLVRPESDEQQAAGRRTFWQWLADVGAAWSAHWSFTALNLLLWAAWLAWNGPQLLKDLPTINGLTMWVSLQAIVMTTFVLVAQKRADDREKRRKELQFQWAAATMDRLNHVADRLEQVERHLGTKPPPHPITLGPLGY